MTDATKLITSPRADKWRKTTNPKITADEVVADLLRVTELIGHAPSYEEMRLHGNISPTTCQRRFGVWENVKRQAGWVPAWETFEPNAVSPTDGHWLAGLIDGEGCFTMRKPKPGHSAWDPLFTMSVRDDDVFMIDEAIRILGIENVHRHTDLQQAKQRKGKTANPAVKLTIYDVHTLSLQLIAVLKLYPLRSKKRNELKVFELAVDALIAKKQEGRSNLSYTEDEDALLRRCYFALKELKQYSANYTAILQSFGLAPG